MPIAPASRGRTKPAKTGKPHITGGIMDRLHEIIARQMNDACKGTILDKDHAHFERLQASYAQKHKPPIVPQKLYCVDCYE